MTAQRPIVAEEAFDQVEPGRQPARAIDVVETIGEQPAERLAGRLELRERRDALGRSAVEPTPANPRPSVCDPATRTRATPCVERSSRHSAVNVTFPLPWSGKAFVGISISSSRRGLARTRLSGSSLIALGGCTPNFSFANCSGACLARTSRSDHFFLPSVVWLVRGEGAIENDIPIGLRGAHIRNLNDELDAGFLR